MSQDPMLPDPSRFSLTSFSELLPPRDPIIGEAPSDFEAFHDAMMKSLMPATPYEAVVAENLIAIEWELIQHRRMREASLRRLVKSSITDAVVAHRKAVHSREMNRAFEQFLAEGGDGERWKDPKSFDRRSAVKAGEELADRATSRNATDQQAALDEIAKLGLEPTEVMSAAYRDSEAVLEHDTKIQQLEKRRRDVKRDFDLLVKVRPVEGEWIEG
ncbi:hypothetical protein [Maritimibacter sp. DP1N21-5]|uniref:hypothetical protein n=1 Tax=Maritimibacter sp. DP1N21-5 TaxID=2836867 RepID=UPI001C48C3F4|nr:hypothetical protein [Maritimibacter sp. DP1N21-5]MBV7410699.1 hypothetical protein [Maritimibacter sp. DP1N21-5]